MRIAATAAAQEIIDRIVSISSHLLPANIGQCAMQLPLQCANWIPQNSVTAQHSARRLGRNCAPLNGAQQAMAMKKDREKLQDDIFIPPSPSIAFTHTHSQSLALALAQTSRTSRTLTWAGKWSSTGAIAVVWLLSNRLRKNIYMYKYFLLFSRSGGCVFSTSAAAAVTDLLLAFEIFRWISLVFISIE